MRMKSHTCNVDFLLLWFFQQEATKRNTRCHISTCFFWSGRAYLVGIRILSVSSISHLFHAVKRRNQEDEKQKQRAGSERRHHSEETKGQLYCHSSDSQLQRVLVQRRAGRARRSQSTRRDGLQETTKEKTPTLNIPETRQHVHSQIVCTLFVISKVLEVLE